MSGSGAGQGVGPPDRESQSARFSVLVPRAGQTSFPNFSKGRGYSGEKKKKKRKKKLLNFSPNSVSEADQRAVPAP